MSEKDPGYIVQDNVKVLQMSEKCNVPLEDVLAADIIICDGKVFKNKWGTNYEYHNRHIDKRRNTGIRCDLVEDGIRVLNLPDNFFDNHIGAIAHSDDVHKADIVLCNGKVLKNRWGTTYKQTDDTCCGN